MLTATIVLYHNNIDVLKAAIESFLTIPLKKRLFLVDNSTNDSLKNISESSEVTYIHTGNNMGFGAGHNSVIDLLEDSEYHLILNPDAYFEKEVVPDLIKGINTNLNIGIIAPKIVYPNGELQLSIRKFPNWYDFLLRRIPMLKKVFPNSFKKGNYLNQDISKPIYVDAVSGCFQLFRTSVFCKIKGFDERYFMYMEDIDICKKVHQIEKAILYYPLTKVYHHSAYGSKRNIKLLKAHISSIIKYFLKWS